LTTYPLESVFVQARGLAEPRDFARVLVLGDGPLAFAAAERFGEEGFETLWVAQGAVSEPPRNVRSLAETRLIALEGMVGDFHARLAGSHGAFVERVGHVVAADDVVWLPSFDDYGLAPSDSVLACSTLETSLNAQNSSSFDGEALLHVAALCGLASESHPLMFRRLLEALLRLLARRPTQAYVFTRNVKTAALGVESLYRAAREAGVLFFKFDGAGPSIIQDGAGVRLVFEDPLLAIPMELSPDIVVVDERPGVSELLARLREAIPSSVSAAPFLSHASPKFLGTATAKAGIFALGAARCVYCPEQAAMDIDAVVLEIKGLNKCPVQASDFGPPEVDQAKCTTCLTCVRLCPHGAMGFLKRAWADLASCMRCGICAAECPAAAITLPPLSEAASLAVRVGEAARESHDSRRIVAFVCEKSGAQALRRCDDDVRLRLVPVVVPCAGSVDLIHLLKAFEFGARGVLIAACHEGACASVYGSNLAKERRAAAGDALEQAGIDPARLLFITLAGNSYRDLAEIVSGFHEGVPNG
jgi:quinone-modifying oxidoreductase, subunit QmoB